MGQFCTRILQTVSKHCVWNSFNLLCNRNYALRNCCLLTAVSNNSHFLWIYCIRRTQTVPFTNFKNVPLFPSFIFTSCSKTQHAWRECAPDLTPFKMGTKTSSRQRNILTAKDKSRFKPRSVSGLRRLFILSQPAQTQLPRRQILYRAKIFCRHQHKNKSTAASGIQT